MHLHLLSWTPSHPLVMPLVEEPPLPLHFVCPLHPVPMAHAEPDPSLPVPPFLVGTRCSFPMDAHHVQVSPHAPPSRLDVWRWRPIASSITCARCLPRRSHRCSSTTDADRRCSDCFHRRPSTWCCAWPSWTRPPHEVRHLDAWHVVNPGTRRVADAWDRRMGGGQTS